MDRKNTWILGGAIVFGFLVFGLSQLWAQRFPGDGRGGEGMVGRFQVVRSSPETILLLDTVTGELYSAGREDIHPTNVRRRGGDIGAPDARFWERGEFKGKEPGPRFQDKGNFKRPAFKDKAVDGPFDGKREEAVPEPKIEDKKE